MNNELNRPQLLVTIGAPAASVEMLAMVAQKKMKVRKASLLDVAAVAASGTNYFSAQLKKNGVAVGTAVDTQAGLSARESLDLDLDGDELELAAGDVLTLDLVKAGTGAFTHAGLALDSLVVGN